MITKIQKNKVFVNSINELERQKVDFFRDFMLLCRKYIRNLVL